MSDIKLVQDILSQIECAANRVQRRFNSIESVNTFLDSEEGLEKLDAEDSTRLLSQEET